MLSLLSSCRAVSLQGQVVAARRGHDVDVPQDGRLLIDEGAVVEQQPEDVGVARLGALVQRRGPHAWLGGEHGCPCCEQEIHHLRLAEAGSNHQRRESFGAGAVHIRLGTQEVRGGCEVTGPDLGFKCPGNPPPGVDDLRSPGQHWWPGQTQRNRRPSRHFQVEDQTAALLEAGEIGCWVEELVRKVESGQGSWLAIEAEQSFE